MTVQRCVYLCLQRKKESTDWRTWLFVTLTPTHVRHVRTTHVHQLVKTSPFTVSLPTCLSTYLRLCLPAYILVCLPIYLPVYLTTRLPTCMLHPFIFICKNTPCQYISTVAPREPGFTVTPVLQGLDPPRDYHISGKEISLHCMSKMYSGVIYTFYKDGLPLPRNETTGLTYFYSVMGMFVDMIICILAQKSYCTSISQVSHLMNNRCVIKLKISRCTLRCLPILVGFSGW